MTKIRLKIGLTLAAATLTSALFNGSTLLRWNTPNTGSSLILVNEASRVSHAKELLGGEYKGSDAQSLEGKSALNEILQKKVQTSLAPRWKTHARAITETVISESSKYNMDPVFVLAVIKTESKFNPLAKGSFGEIGLMQIKPNTAEWIAKKFKIAWNGKKTLENPSANIKIGLAYMNYLRTKFNRKALKYVSAYNMGPTNVRRLIAMNIKPAEYNARVMKNYSQIYAVISTNEKPAGTLLASN